MFRTFALAAVLGFASSGCASPTAESWRGRVRGGVDPFTNVTTNRTACHGRDGPSGFASWPSIDASKPSGADSFEWALDIRMVVKAPLQPDFTTAHARGGQALALDLLTEGDRCRYGIIGERCITRAVYRVQLTADLIEKGANDGIELQLSGPVGQLLARYEPYMVGAIIAATRGDFETRPLPANR